MATSDGIVGALRIGRWLFTRTVEGVGWASLGSRSFRGWFCLANDEKANTYEFTGVAGARVKVDYFVAFRTGEGSVLAISDGIVVTLRREGS